MGLVRVAGELCVAGELWGLQIRKMGLAWAQIKADKVNQVCLAARMRGSQWVAGEHCRVDRCRTRL